MSKYIVRIENRRNVAWFLVVNGEIASPLPAWLTKAARDAGWTSAREIAMGAKVKRWGVDHDELPGTDTPPPWCQATRDLGIVHITPPGRYMTVAEARERGVLV